MFATIEPLFHCIDVKYVAEFAGTFLLVFFGTSVGANVSLVKTKGFGGGYLPVVIGWSVGLTVAVFLFMNVSGAHFNPAVTIAFWTAGTFPCQQVIPYILTQFAGAIFGAVMTYLVYFKHFAESSDADAKLGVFATSPGVPSAWWNCFAEGVATGILVFVVTGLGYAATGGDGGRAFDPGFSALSVGLLLLAIGLGLGGPTGFAINPARDLGPRLVHFFLPIPGKRDSNWEYAWVPVVGPILGGLAGYWSWFLLFGNQTLPMM